MVEVQAQTVGLSQATRVAPPVPPPPPPPPPPPAPPAEPTVAELEAEVLRLTNAERTSRGLSPLASHRLLVVAATTHAVDQREFPCTFEYLSHTGTDGSSPMDRILRTGISISRYGENVGCGFRSAAAVVRAWMDSPGHRANVLYPGYTHIGIAVERSSTGRYYWVQDFATAR